MTDTTTNQRTCRACGEPELVGVAGGGQFGWFTSEDRGKFVTRCLRCGANPTAKPRRRGQAATRRAGQPGQIDAQGRSHVAADCGSYQLLRRVGPNRWEVQWTAPCDDPTRTSTLQFVSRDQYSRHF